MSTRPRKRPEPVVFSSETWQALERTSLLAARFRLGGASSQSAASTHTDPAQRQRISTAVDKVLAAQQKLADFYTLPVDERSPLAGKLFHMSFKVARSEWQAARRKRK